MVDNPNDITRRSVLRKSVASAAGIGTVATAASTSATASPDMDEAAFEAAESYLSTSAIHEALETHAGDALAEAADQGVLATADPGALPLDAVHETPTAWVEASEGATAFAEEHDGEPSPRIKVKQPLPDSRTFKLAVRPAEGEARWTVRDSVDTEQSDSPGTASSHICGGCWEATDCVYVCVGGTCEARWLYCCCDHTCESGDACSSAKNCDCQDICGVYC